MGLDQAAIHGDWFTRGFVGAVNFRKLPSEVPPLRCILSSRWRQRQGSRSLVAILDTMLSGGFQKVGAPFGSTANWDYNSELGSVPGPPNHGNPDVWMVLSPICRRYCWVPFSTTVLWEYLGLIIVYYSMLSYIIVYYSMLLYIIVYYSIS